MSAQYTTTHYRWNALYNHTAPISCIIARFHYTAYVCTLAHVSMEQRQRRWALDTHIPPASTNTALQPFSCQCVVCVCVVSGGCQSHGGVVVEGRGKHSVVAMAYTKEQINKYEEVQCTCVCYRC